MAKKTESPRYETMNAELETILAELQRSDLDVDEALQLYERGLELTQALQAYLEKAELKITELKDGLADKS